MAMEVVCGNCQGRLLVEHTGVIVACPHCGAHLQIGDPTPPASATTSTVPPPSAPSPAVTPSEPSAPIFPPQFMPPAAPEPVAAVPPPPFEIQPPPFFPELTSAPETLPEIILTPPPPITRQASVAADARPVLEETTELFAPPSPEEASSSDSDTWMPKIDLALPPKGAERDALPAISETSTLVLPQPPGTPPAAAGESAAPAARTEKTGIWSRSTVDNLSGERPTIILPGEEHPTVPGFEGFSPAAAASPVTTPTVNIPESSTVTPQYAAAPAKSSSPAPTIVTSEARREAVVPRYLFIIVASYASAITIAFLYLWWRGSVSTLDLPDIVPEFNKSGKVGLSLINETPLPPAYRLKLGESRQYGNVKITPLKVTRGPLEFTHYINDGQTKAPTNAPVLKLWVKFENVSNDQTFPALDENLLFRTVPDKQNVMQDRTNNYVCKQSERKRIGKRVPVYAYPINSEWFLKDQNLNTPLEPHAEWKTYIPTNDEDLSSLEGPLTWRLHFRKGYNPKSFRGVTTLVEVEFDSQDIQG